jgi:predicted RNA-binding protein with RPS1 domain
MSVVKTYWAMPVEESKPFVEKATQYNSNRIEAFLQLQEKVGCDSINVNTNGSILLSYKEKQDQPWLTKRPAYTAGGLYHYFTKAKTPQYSWVREAQEKVSQVQDFQSYCKEQFPDSEVSLMDARLGNVMLAEDEFFETSSLCHKNRIYVPNHMEQSVIFPRPKSFTPVIFFWCLDKYADEALEWAYRIIIQNIEATLRDVNKHTSDLKTYLEDCNEELSRRSSK